MIKMFRNLFNELSVVPAEQPLSLEQRQRATAALLIEIACADRDYSTAEIEKLREILQRKFDLPKADLEEITQEAQRQQADATSLFEFTQLINEHCSAEEKYQLVVAMWEVAFADGELDKHEVHIIRRVADLIHLPHSYFIRAKLSVQNS